MDEYSTANMNSYVGHSFVVRSAATNEVLEKVSEIYSTATVVIQIYPHVFFKKL